MDCKDKEEFIERLEDIRLNLYSGYSVRATDLKQTPKLLNSDGGSILNYNIINPNNNVVYLKLFDVARGSDTNSIIFSAPIWIIMIGANDSKEGSVKLGFNQDLYAIAVNGLEDGNNAGPINGVFTQLICR